MERLQHLFLVDQWQKQSGAYFLTHMHSDHIKGLGSTWSRGPLYCSHVTAQLLCVRFPGFSKGLLRPLDVGVSTMIEVWTKERRQELMEVTPINAHHCPGSVMFLFRGSFGTRLHTGDFRWDAFLPISSSPAAAASPSLPETSGLALMHSNDSADEAGLSLTSGLRQLQDALQGRPIDALVLDNTYCHPKYWFPKRADALEQVCAILEAHPEHNALIGIDSLGKEDLLVAIATRLQTKIAVSSERFAFAQLLGLPDVFTVLPSPSIYSVVPPSDSPKSSEAPTPLEPVPRFDPSGLSESLEPSQPSAYSAPYKPAAPLEPVQTSEPARPRMCAVPRRSVNLDHLRVLNASAPTIGIVPSGWRSLDPSASDLGGRGAVPGSVDPVFRSGAGVGDPQAPLSGLSLGSASAAVGSTSMMTSAEEASGTAAGMGAASQERLSSAMHRTRGVRVQGAAATTAAMERLKSPPPEPRKPCEPLLFRVPYSLHSCFAELDAFVRLVRPTTIRPIAGKDPYGLDTCPSTHFGELCERWGQERGLRQPNTVCAEIPANLVSENGFGRTNTSAGAELLEEDEDALVLKTRRGRKRTALPKVRRVAIRRKRCRVGSVSPVETEAKNVVQDGESAGVGGKLGRESAWSDTGSGEALGADVSSLRFQPDSVRGCGEKLSSTLSLDARLRDLSPAGMRAYSGLSEGRSVKHEEGGSVACEWLTVCIERSKVRCKEKSPMNPGGNVQRLLEGVVPGEISERHLSDDRAYDAVGQLPGWYLEAHDRWIADAVIASEACCDVAAAADERMVGRDTEQVQQLTNSRSSKRTLPKYVTGTRQVVGR